MKKKKNLGKIEIENGVFGAQILEVTDLATSNRSKESREGEEVPAAPPLRLLYDVFAVMLCDDGRRVQVNRASCLGLTQHVV